MDETSGPLYLIDTMGYIFRAFHALPPMMTSSGQPTGAVLGFVNMLRKLLQEAAPSAIAAVYDMAGPTFRDAAFAAYKANREAMPDALAAQLPFIRRSLEAFRIPILEAAGFEADDVIGTIAKKAAAVGREVVIVSSDKDLLQLVRDGVRVYNPSKNLVLDAAKVVEVLGVRPDQVADLLALRGDSVDNIPGAPGIGDKGSVQLIQRFGTVEEALARAGEVERKTYRESLQGNRDQILLSKELATIHCEAPVEYEPAAWGRQEPDAEACRALFREMEFMTLLKQVTAPETPVAVTAPAAAASVAADAAALEAFWAVAKGARVALALGAEGAGLATGEGPAWRVSGDLLAGLASPLCNAEQAWQWHDSKAVYAALRRAGLPRPPLRAETIEDVTLLAFLHDPTQGAYDLEAIERRVFGAEARGAADAGEEAAEVRRLAATLRPRVEASGQWPVYRDLDLPLIPVLEEMESAGVRIDPAQLAALSSDLEKRCAECQEKIFGLAGETFNLNSPKQLGEILFGKMGLPQPARRGKSKTPSTAVDVLEELTQYDVIPPILEYRQFSKLKSTYVDALPPLIDATTGRVHTTFTLAGSATGRLASSNPNLQNIPIRTEVGRQIRAAFVADPGHVLVTADYSQIELRLLAHCSQDPLLLDAYRTGLDIHRLTASEVFGVPPLMISDEHRRRAKAVNFGIVYGLSAFGLSRQLGIARREAEQFIQRYFERYAGVQRYIEATLARARQEGCVRTLHGRVRPIPNLDDRNATLRGFAERTAINTPLQGTAADLIKLAMIRLQPRLAETGARLLLQVHDELVLEVEQSRAAALAATVKEVMEGVAELAVPLEVETGVGPNWRDQD